MTTASPDLDPEAIKAFEKMIARQAGLNAQEIGSIHVAGQNLRVQLNDIRRASASITGGKSSLTPADVAALAALTDQREQFLSTAAKQILSNLRPEAAARLQTPGGTLTKKPTAVKRANTPQIGP